MMKMIKRMPNHIVPVGNHFAISARPLGIPGSATDELKITFLQATQPLPRDIQELIWKEVLYCTTPVPEAPKKCNPSYTISANVLNGIRRLQYE